MNKSKLQTPALLTCSIALIWAVNGLYCKILGMVPRHEQIVARILGNTYAEEITKLIGIGELALAIWILSGIYRRWCVVLQIMLIGIMNIIEFVAAPDLLLFGKFNIILAFLLIMVIYYNENTSVRSRSLLR